MTKTGLVVGSDGKTIQNFSVEVTNSSGEIVLNQDFKNGSYTLDIIPGFGYWFTGLPIYGGVLYSGDSLKAGGVVTIPINFSLPAPIVKTYYGIAIALISITLIHEFKKKKSKRH